MTSKDIKKLRDKIDDALELLDVTLEQASKMFDKENEGPKASLEPTVSGLRKFKPNTEVFFLFSKDSRIYQAKAVREDIKLVFTEDGNIEIDEHKIKLERLGSKDFVQMGWLDADLVFETKEELLSYLERTAE